MFGNLISVSLVVVFSSATAQSESLILVTRQEVDDEEWRKAESCETPDGVRGKCIQLFSCASLLPLFANPPPNRISYVKKFICGGYYYTYQVCCPRFYDYNEEPRHNVSVSDKRFCGQQHYDDYFGTGSDSQTEIDEFPWVAALMHLLYEAENVYCQGALINERYVLTSGGCTVITEQMPYPWIRLGEHHYKNKMDCVHLSYATDCNEPQDFGIEETFKHPFYNWQDYVYPRINNLGLLRLNKSATYSDYIRPICLPTLGTNLPKTGDNLYSSGWAKARDESNSTIAKRKSVLTLVDSVDCHKLLISRFPPAAKIDTLNASAQATNYFMCGLGKKVLCSDTDGEPVMFSHKLQWYLLGMSTWNVPCNITVAARYTRVDTYLKWISDAIQTLTLKYSNH